MPLVSLWLFNYFPILDIIYIHELLEIIDNQPNRHDFFSKNKVQLAD